MIFLWLIFLHCIFYFPYFLHVSSHIVYFHIMNALHVSKEESRAVTPVPSGAGPRSEGPQEIGGHLFGPCAPAPTPYLVSASLCLKSQRLKHFLVFPICSQWSPDLPVAPPCCSLQIILFPWMSSLSGFWFTDLRNCPMDFPGCPEAGTQGSQCSGRVWSLVRELDPTCLNCCH